MSYFDFVSKLSTSSSTYCCFAITMVTMDEKPEVELKCDLYYTSDYLCFLSVTLIATCDLVTTWSDSSSIEPKKTFISLALIYFSFLNELYYR